MNITAQSWGKGGNSHNPGVLKKKSLDRFVLIKINQRSVRPFDPGREYRFPPDQRIGGGKGFERTPSSLCWCAGGVLEKLFGNIDPCGRP